MPELIARGLFENGGRAGISGPALERDLDLLESLRAGLASRASDGAHLLGCVPPRDEEIEPIRLAAEALGREGDRLVVVGIGGSSLGGKTLCSLAPAERVFFLEGTDPEGIARDLESIPWDRSCLNIISKSGGTLETLVNAGLCLESLQRAAPSSWKRRVLVTASPGEGRLQKWSREEGLASLAIPQPVGGRFSVLTPVGLLPAAFAGIAPEEVAAGARRAAGYCLGNAGEDNPALLLAWFLARFFEGGLREVDLWGYGGTCHSLCRWLQQLWAESLGRSVPVPGGDRRVGPTPLACLGSEDQHSLLQLFLDGPEARWVLLVTAEGEGPALGTGIRKFAGLPGSAASLGRIQEALWRGTERALLEASVPSGRYHMGPLTAGALGESFYTFQVSTLIAAGLLGVDPFGQRAVEAGKRFTREFLGEGGS